MKAIETVYQGYRFRSRLEARWAVFFDAYGVSWEYEKEGFNLGEYGYYLPDFWLPDSKLWVEIKPADADADADTLSKIKTKLEGLYHCTSSAVVLAVGLPGGDVSVFVDDVNHGGSGQMWWGPASDIMPDSHLVWCWNVEHDCLAVDIPMGQSREFFTYERACNGVVNTDNPTEPNVTYHMTEQAAIAAKQARFEHGQTPVFNKKGVYTG